MFVYTNDTDDLNYLERLILSVSYKFPLEFFEGYTASFYSALERDTTLRYTQNMCESI